MKKIHWYPGHMAKTRRLIEEKIKLIDVVIEILDARIPYASKNPDLDKWIFNKEKIIVFSKIDMADEKQTQAWIKYYEQQGHYVIGTNLLEFKQLNRILNSIEKKIADKKAKVQAKGLQKQAIRALVVGIPNVGKSTFINKIAKRKSAKTGDRAGVTKALQWVKTANNLELLDSPGVLWPRLDDEKVAINLALTGAIKEEILPKDELCLYALRFLNTHYPELLYKRYAIPRFENDNIENIIEALKLIAKLRGCKQKHDEYDYEKVYDIILKELKSNKIGRVTFDYE